MEPVRIAVIGVSGSAGLGHIQVAKELPTTKLAAVVDVVAEAAKKAGEEHKVPWFTSVDDLAKSGAAEAVVIATPHWWHPPIAIDAAGAGLHVLTEKPMAVTPAAADEMIAACKKAGVTLAVVFQFRFDPVRVKSVELLRSGAIGEIARGEVINCWFRPDAYYRSAAWRGTWAGEGGGVLVNQAPHYLDQYLWHMGMMPSRVIANVQTSIHKMEAEDRATAILEFPNGAIGHVHFSTAEAPNLVRMEFAGDRGRLTWNEGGKLQLHRLDESAREVSASSKDMWGLPKGPKEPETIDVPKPEGLAGAYAVVNDFAEAVRNKRPPRVTGDEGRKCVEVASAIIMSGLTKKPVDLPMDAEKYEAFMRKLTKGKDPRTMARKKKK
jgi:UDP-N-acetyl-2-amino-2-deoxyglucuronate dehydrogenase